MKNFIGTYECKIDDKGRVKLPASLTKQMEHFADEPFVIKRSVFQKCLEVYPMKPWEKLMAKINGLNRFVKKNAELDNVGRLQISKDLTQFANLGKDIVITSAGELFEIWDKDSYEQVISVSESDFASLAEDVMGNLDSEESN